MNAAEALASGAAFTPVASNGLKAKANMTSRDTPPARPALRLRFDRSARAMAPLPAEADATPWIGRAGELERLRQAWRRAAVGERQIVLVSGQAGVGKTRPIERFVSEVGEFHCAHGHV
jgi:transcriptional regulator with AAA-type ATPase domain